MSHPDPVPHPVPPYYAVVFSSRRTDADAEAYQEAAERMVALAADQPGFLGVESVRGADGSGITVSYWRDPESIAAWRSHAEHALVQRQGRERRYQRSAVRAARLGRASAGPYPACPPHRGA